MRMNLHESWVTADDGDYDDENDNNKHDDDNAVWLEMNIGICV